MPVRILFPLLIMVLLYLQGCTSGSCDEPTEALLNISLQYTDSENKAMVDSITVFGAGTVDQLLYDTVSTSTLSLPMNPAEASLQFVIRKGQYDDTITIDYDTELIFISKSCGYSFFYKIKEISYSTNRIDNTLIINRYVTPGNEENLRTFY